MVLVDRYKVGDRYAKTLQPFLLVKKFTLDL